MMSEKILLVDGHSIINRAFYGVTDLTNSEGLHTNAVFGFLNTLFKVLDEEKPDYVTVAFDVKAPTFRHEMYEAYKGTRKPMPRELHEQVPVLKELLHAMGILTMEKAGLEADDLLGTVAKTRRGQRNGSYRAFRRSGSSAACHGTDQNPSPKDQRRNYRDKKLSYCGCPGALPGDTSADY